MGLTQEVNSRFSHIWKYVEAMRGHVTCAETRLAAIEKALGNVDDDPDTDKAAPSRAPQSQLAQSQLLPTIFGEGGVAPFPPPPTVQSTSPAITRADLSILIEEHREALEKIEEMKQELRALLAGKKKSKR